MKKQTTRVCVLLGTFAVLAVAGCELAVDFDRTKIDSGTFDASIGETSTFDAPVTMDGTTGDGTVPDDSGTDSADGATISDAGDSSIVADADDGSDGADE